MTYLKTLNNKKTVFAVLTTLILVVVIFALMTHTVSAEPAVVKPQSGASLGGAMSGLALPQLVLVTAILFILKGILTVIMSIAALGLEYAYYLNLTTLPASIPAVELGWKILRDIANSFFILIILWIAFTIIFNIEHLGGKKLLLRVVIIALLINFSLAMVTTVFGFTNIVANTFAKNIPKDVTGFIADIWSLQNLGTQNAREIAAAKDAARAEPGTIPVTGEVNPLGSLNNSLIASIGIKQSQAQGGTIAGIASGCALGIFGGPAGCAIGAIAGGAIGAIADLSGIDVVGATAKVALREGMVVIYLLLATAAFLLAMIALFMRLIAMAVLSIFAPAAFLLYVVPSKMASKYFDQWLNALFKWAFFAPIFYFLFYLSLIMIQAAKPKTLEDPSINPERFVVLIISLGLIWAAVRFARKGSGVVGETAIGLGKMAGMLALGGAGALAARSATVALSKEGVQEKMQGWAERPGLRWLGGAVPMRATQQFLEKQRLQVEEKRKRLGTMSDSSVVAEASGATSLVSPKQGVAAFKELAERGLIQKNIDKLGDVNRIRSWAEIAAQTGNQYEIVQAVPQVIDDQNFKKLVPDSNNKRDAVIKAIKRSADKTKLNAQDIQDDETKNNVLAGIIFNLKGSEELGKIARQNRRQYDVMIANFRDNQAALKREYTMTEDAGGRGKTPDEWDTLQNMILDYDDYTLDRRGRGGRRRRRP